MMSVKRMIDLYVEYGVDEDTWNMLYEMSIHGLISRDNWIKFFNICASWFIDGDAIRDGDGLMVYRIDEKGLWKKV